ncbi:MAG: hypothetical protein C5B54_00745 [Acidobacteria bacterium]|nr:MAG: hypothetical protein C5B54_00745 [Acidobacteriota bacterium]
MSLVRTEYYRSDLLRVRYVACRSAGRGLSEIEETENDTLIFPLRGAFIEHFSRNHEILAEPNIALLVRAASFSRVSHPVSSQDDSLVIDFSSTFFRDIAERSDSAHISSGHSVLNPAMMAARNLIWNRFRRGFIHPLEVEETATALLSYSLRFTQRIRGFRRSSKMPRQIEAAKVVLLSHPERNWKLSELAHALECSPYYLTRMFRWCVGIPLHRYQLNTRFARAVDLLLDSDEDLATIAIHLGFSSHSHFTASFHQAVGFTPTELRECGTRDQLAAIRKLLY